ncbi:MAG: hypothetical protein Q8Q41_02665, partial [bacterium]|nr:hypothetical protein [bacterium]
MSDGTFQGTIREIEVVHRKSITTDEGYRRYARIVVWATMNTGKRVWVRTVEGGLDPLFIGVKVVMAQEFFSKLAGRKIRFHEDDSGEGGRIFFAEKESLPEKFLVSYQEIKKVMWKWVEERHGGELKRLQAEKLAKATATRAESAVARREDAARLGLRENATRQEVRLAEEEKWRRWERERDEQEWRLREEKLAKRRNSSLHLAFERGYNPKRGSEQWE